jgi:hypothetical protein
MKRPIIFDWRFLLGFLTPFVVAALVLWWFAP